MQVTAMAAKLGLIRRVGFLPLLHWQDDAVDEVARAFVVDDRAGTKLGDRQEPGPGKEFVATLPGPPTRDVGREGKPRKVVAWQEALAGKVPVAVEVGLGDVFSLGQQFELRFGLLAEAFGSVFIGGRSGGVTDDPILDFPLTRAPRGRGRATDRMLRRNRGRLDPVTSSSQRSVNQSDCIQLVPETISNSFCHAARLSAGSLGSQVHKLA